MGVLRCVLFYFIPSYSSPMVWKSDLYGPGGPGIFMSIKAGFEGRRTGYSGQCTETGQDREELALNRFEA